MNLLSLIVLSAALVSYVAYYENGANEGTPAGTYGGHRVKEGPSLKKGNSEEGLQSTKDETIQEKMDAWLEEMNAWRKETTPCEVAIRTCL
jgi:hypothetical protein